MNQVCMDGQIDWPTLPRVFKHVHCTLNNGSQYLESISLLSIEQLFLINALQQSEPCIPDFLAHLSTFINGSDYCLAIHKKPDRCSINPVIQPGADSLWSLTEKNATVPFDCLHIREKYPWYNWQNGLRFRRGTSCLEVFEECGRLICWVIFAQLTEGIKIKKCIPACIVYVFVERIGPAFFGRKVC